MTQKLTLQGLLWIFPILIAGSSMIACSPSKNINPDYIYFRDGADTVATPQKEVVIQPNDLLSIQVYSKSLNQDQAAIFNMPTTANTQPQGYQVATTGNIDMPVIGSVKAAGLTKAQLQALLVEKLTEYVKNPTVLIRFLEFKVNVLGEVKTPGIQKFNIDRVTIIDAISAAGDLTDFGKREDVTVIREVDSKKVYHTIDLRNRNLFESPVYVLEPNDIVYVGPNKSKLKNLSVDPQAQRKTNLIFGITSVAISVATLLISILR